LEALDNLFPLPKSPVTITGSGLAHPVTVSRDVYCNLFPTTIEEEINN